jgi:FMN-binding domain
MPHSATSSDPAPPLHPRRPGLAFAVAAALLVGGGPARPASARVLLTTDEALRLAYPGCTVSRGTVYLTAEQKAAAAALAQVEIPSAVIHPYRAQCDTADGGTAYFDTHRVRTLLQTMMIALAPDGRVARVEVLVFDEPETYLPRAPWLGQFPGQALDAELALKRDIRGIAGASLTARATVAAVRRVLAIHAVLSGSGAR